MASPARTRIALTPDETALHVIDADGVRHLVMRSVGAPGTRAPIHVHAFGGTTPVLEGQMTNYLEGSHDTTAKTGDS
ncbi:MAG: hypothetical protein K9G80_05390 [Candidatus Nanopelagicales bacterium]|nr:hypothetical protein [Candidatus Nanopelagicales bacterium]